jgi:predicted CXXCH cytochrome family protein
METHRRTLCFLLVLVFLFAFESSALSRDAFSPYSPAPSPNTGLKKNSCTSRDCHFNKFEKIEYSFCRHPGASKTEEDNSCIFCHAEENLLRRDTGNDKTGRISDPALRTMHVVTLSNLTQSTKYQFRIRSTDTQGKTVLIESNEFVFTTASVAAADNKGLSTAAFPSAKQELGNSVPPQIMAISIQGMKWGPLLSAKIAWKTDVPSTSKVEYGITPSFGSTTPVDFSLVLDHAVSIHGLRPGITYYYRVHSTTPPGCCAASEPRTFKTPSSKITLLFEKRLLLYEWLLPSAIAQSFSAPLLITHIAVSKVAERRATITWETNRPSDTHLEYQAQTSKEDSANFLHPPMKKKEKAGLEACYSCHPKEKIGKSHPVKVTIHKALRKPQDLPLGEGEVILCTTCHDPHGCNQRFLVRKDHKRDLCISCHNPERIDFRQFRRR